MRCFVGSDDTTAAGRVRDLLVELGHACPASHVHTLDRVWGELDKDAAGPTAAQMTIAEKSRGGPAGAEIEIVVIVLGPDAERALAVVQMNRRRTAAQILLVGPTIDTKMVLRALRAGANEFLDQADLRSELAAALQRVAVETAPGKVIGVLSASRGCGCSTIAVNLAAGIAKTHARCALLDLQIEFGDLATLLDLKPSFTIADLCKNTGRLDASLLDGCLMPHSSGIQLLAGSGNIAERTTMTEESFCEVISLVARRFPIAVADLGNLIRNERTRVLLQMDLILLVFRMDFACLRNTRAALEHLSEIGIGKDRVEVIANRSGQSNEIPAATAEEALGVKIAHYVPDDAKTVNRANNNGVPVLLQSPASKVARVIADLAAHVSKAPAAPAP